MSTFTTLICKNIFLARKQPKPYILYRRTPSSLFNSSTSMRNNANLQRCGSYIYNIQTGELTILWFHIFFLTKRKSLFSLRGSFRKGTLFSIQSIRFLECFQCIASTMCYTQFHPCHPYFPFIPNLDCMHCKRRQLTQAVLTLFLAQRVTTKGNRLITGKAYI